MLADIFGCVDTMEGITVNVITPAEFIGDIKVYAF